MTTEPETPEIVPHFSSEDIRILTGCTYRQLWYWVDQGYLFPENRRGSGHAWRFTHDEARFALYLARYVRMGYAPRVAARISRDRVAPEP
jgi:hypothetical protein